MSLTAGQSLSFYEILAPLGAGGMGEVWRARDTRLEREVAIKVLPAAFADDDERLRRFEREAKLLASLNHPNVAQIYGVDQVGDTCFLALELVEGETLAARLRRGALEVDEALDVCRQIAEGLEAAHEAGVIHRDLKPANVCIRPDGRVKVLDFGLAKPARAGDAAEDESALSTEAGRLLGTPTYMAPEQARGRAVDRRVDVWAFGCVLRECLTGERTFAGETVSDVLGAVLHTEPEAELPAGVPPGVRALIARCLVKDPRRRLRDVGEARLVLEQPGLGAAEQGSPARGGVGWPWVGAALAAGVALGAFALRGEPAGRDAERAAPAPLRLSIHAPGLDSNVFPRLSPDGRTVVYLHEPDGDGASAEAALFRRDLDRFETRRLPGTERTVTFCFSPDGAHLAALVEDPDDEGGFRVRRVALRDGAPTVDLGAWPVRFNERSGIVWMPDATLVSSAVNDRLLLFPLEGNEAPSYRPIRRTLENAAMGVEVYRDLRDGRHVLGRTFQYDERGFIEHVVTVDVETGLETVLVRNGSHGAFVEAGGRARLLFARGDTLFEVPFDRTALATTGPAVPIVAGLLAMNYWQSGWFDASRDGTLVWQPGGRIGGAHYLVTIEADGSVAPVWPERVRHDERIDAAPDGSFFAATIVATNGLVEVWGSELDDPLPRALLAAPGADFLSPLAIPGTEDLVYLRLGADRDDGIFRAPRASPGQRELLIAVDDPGRNREPVAVTPDGKQLLIRDVESGHDVFSLLALDDPAPRKPRTLMTAVRGDIRAKFSPDGRWLAYLSTAGMEGSVVVRRFHPEGRVGEEVPVPVARNPGPQDLVWFGASSGVQELVLLDATRSRIVAIPVHEGPPVRFGAPRPVAALAPLHVADLAALPGGRLLALIEDRTDRADDRIEVSIGALGDR